MDETGRIVTIVATVLLVAVVGFPLLHKAGVALTVALIGAACLACGVGLGVYLARRAP